MQFVLITSWKDVEHTISVQSFYETTQMKGHILITAVRTLFRKKTKKKILDIAV